MVLTEAQEKAYFEPTIENKIKVEQLEKQFNDGPHCLSILQNITLTLLPVHVGVFFGVGMTLRATELASIVGREASTPQDIDPL